jgi:pimeloyl-ACP methyl ester carboxylesterase
MLTRSATRSLVVTFCCILLCACGTTGRKKGLEELKALALYAGVVTHESPASSLIVVVLLDAADDSTVNFSVADSRGRFDILGKPGDYRFLAYVDLDADFQWDEGEPWALSATPAIDISDRPEDGGANAITIAGSAAGAPPVNVDLSAQELPKGEEIREAALGRVVAIDDPRLGPDVGLTSLWHPVDFLKGKNAGVFLLEEFDPSRIPVILVNGIGGSPSELRTIAESLDRERFQPVFLTYPSGLSIELNGWWLSRLAVEIRARRKYDGDTIVIAHSMGGLVARTMINRLVRAAGHSPMTFISISTPWGGHESSSERGARMAAVPVWADLVPQSAFLASLYDQPLPDDLHYYLLFGFSGESALVRGSDDGTVTIPSMLDYRAQDQARKTFGFAESHTSILESEKAIATILAILDEEAARARTADPN